MFILKKILAQFFFPVPLCLEILIAGLLLILFTKKQKTGKIIISIGIVIFALFSFPALPNFFLERLEYRYQPLALTTASDTSTCYALPAVKWIVILGGGQTSDHNIPITSWLSKTSLVRLVEGLRLHKKIPESKIILSGGKVFDVVSEAEIMAEVAVSIGVNREDLILEQDSNDTKDQARIIRPIVGSDVFILVTSASHMPRSMALFKKQGMHPIAAPAGHTVKKNRNIHPTSLFPNSWELVKAEGVIYEYLGLLMAKLRGQI